ncbi:ribonuclease R [Gynuella sp.]|uniref:ribonuclease R n=1 Tax=Gynuella sp. TaxID=2969146 RepID=UPI003D112126
MPINYSYKRTATISRQKKDRAIKDPHARREAENYADPIPSREYILTHLQERNGPASHPEICQALSLTTDNQIEALRRRLIAMVRDGQIRCSRNGAFGLINKMNLAKGRVQGHQDGYGFLIAEDGRKDIYLNSNQMSCVFDGDVVLVRETERDFRGRMEGKIVDVLERNTLQLVCRYHEQSGIGFGCPENRKIHHDILIKPGTSAGATDGDIVLIEIVEQPRFRHQPIGKVVEVMGKHLDPGMEIDIALQTFAIPHSWPEEVEQQARLFKSDVSPKDKQGRVDLSKYPLVTIDGEDARDFDDAVYARRTREGGWKLFVAIADVSHYVKPDSALDHEAFNRGTSVYFPERVVPMLPEVLSNGLCSLNPHVDRLAICCEMTFGPRGTMKEYKFYEALIHSHARLTYNQVATMLMNPDLEKADALRQQFSHVLPCLETLHELYKVLRKLRNKRGAIDFETQETRIVFNDNQKIDRIVPVERNDAHKLIEECMLAANTCTADFLDKLEIPALYRVHAGPSFEKLENLRSYLGELGLEIGGGLKPSPADYQKLLLQIKDRDDFDLIQTVLLRSLSQAVYQPQNEGHFGLGYDAYTHFTSPIRRYPDLLVHRAIRGVIHSGRRTALVKRVKDTPKIDATISYPYDLAKMLMYGEHCSMTERRADEATWDVIAWLKCEYIEDHIGDVFTGTVASVVAFGLFVQLDDIFVEGLIHVTSLNSDYYVFDPAGHRLVGERTRTVYSLGDKVSVRVARVNLDERKIDFELENQIKTARRTAASRKSASKTAKESGKRPANKTSKHKSKSKSGKAPKRTPKADFGKAHSHSKRKKTNR